MSKSEDHSVPSPVATADLRLFARDLAGQWYVAHTRSRHEKILAKELSRMGICNYLPLTRRVTRSVATHRISRSVVPLFPGYVFFNGTEEQRYQTLTTNRVANVLDVPNQDQLVAELLHIQHLLENTQEFLLANRLKVGEWARIIAGPLCGLEGIVTRYSGRLRLAMNVTILGQSVSVEVDHDVVERTDPPAYLGKGASSL